MNGKRPSCICFAVLFLLAGCGGSGSPAVEVSEQDQADGLRLTQDTLVATDFVIENSEGSLADVSALLAATITVPCLTGSMTIDTETGVITFTDCNIGTAIHNGTVRLTPGEGGTVRRIEFNTTVSCPEGTSEPYTMTGTVDMVDLMKSFGTQGSDGFSLGFGASLTDNEDGTVSGTGEVTKEGETVQSCTFTNFRIQSSECEDFAGACGVPSSACNR